MVCADAIDRDLSSLPEIERPNVVQAHNVVGMGVGKQNGVQTLRCVRAEPACRKSGVVSIRTLWPS